MYCVQRVVIRNVHAHGHCMLNENSCKVVLSMVRREYNGKHMASHTRFVSMRKFHPGTSLDIQENSAMAHNI